MSLYSNHEICQGCEHAVFHDCNRCLRNCAAGREHERNHINGSCSGFEPLDNYDIDAAELLRRTRGNR